MGYEMTGKERHSLQKIAKRIAIQSECHTANITEYYQVMVEVARKEFYEDNEITLYNFLLELFQIAFSSSKQENTRKYIKFGIKFGWKDSDGNIGQYHIAHTKEELFEQLGFDVVDVDKPIKGRLAVKVQYVCNSWCEYFD